MAQGNLSNVKSHYWIFVSSNSSKSGGHSGENMSSGFDIFQELSDGSPLWVAHAPTLKEAKEKLSLLVCKLTASYFIRDAREGQIVARQGPTTTDDA